jgi:haloacetate dehalogenase
MANMDFDGFRSGLIETGEAQIFARWAGEGGPPVLLLHGFPETHLMWREIAPALARRFVVVCADLLGYGASGCPASDARHEPYSKRAMARDMVGLMRTLGHERFAVVGHDRGGRVAYRLALDHPQRCQSLTVLDVIPTADTWSRADYRFALGYWPWTFFAQDGPLPEQALSKMADQVVNAALDGWGSAPKTFAPELRAAYAQPLRDPAHAHAICEEYRAAASRDKEHDLFDLENGSRIRCPLSVVWSAKGALAEWYEADGGPLGIWRRWAGKVSGRSIHGGHFFPEELPAETSRELALAIESGVR